MKLDTEPRLAGVSATVMEWARKVAQASNRVNGFFSSKNLLSISNGGTGASTPLAARAALGAQLEPGIVGYTAASTPPTGWIKANGASISREAYAALFVSIGTTFGAGDGSTTFTLPDLRGEFIRALDDGRGVDLGRPLGAAQADAMQAHAHTAAGNVTGSAGAPYNAFMVGPGSSFGEPLSGRMSIGEASASSQGAPRLAGETRPRNVALLACIKF